ncbi:hypothetical protein ILUMI_11859 [Ignelater luminosus]|uniref:Uncharacterized protein n=1 Tax=Ignelater luminosus TaxID=2038154 RepID=A0A8K0CZJ7_IGNLU|nr:hypothetical protein ILUMI_11859 [Ignelater luminosus]
MKYFVLLILIVGIMGIVRRKPMQANANYLIVSERGQHCFGDTGKQHTYCWPSCDEYAPSCFKCEGMLKCCKSMVA